MKSIALTLITLACTFNIARAEHADNEILLASEDLAYVLRSYVEVELSTTGIKTVSSQINVADVTSMIVSENVSTIVFCAGNPERIEIWSIEDNVRKIQFTVAVEKISREAAVVLVSERLRLQLHPNTTQLSVRPHIDQEDNNNSRFRLWASMDYLKGTGGAEPPAALRLNTSWRWSPRLSMDAGVGATILNKNIQRFPGTSDKTKAIFFYSGVAHLWSSKNISLMAGAIAGVFRASVSGNTNLDGLKGTTSHHWLFWPHIRNRATIKAGQFDLHIETSAGLLTPQGEIGGSVSAGDKINEHIGGLLFSVGAGIGAQW